MKPLLLLSTLHRTHARRSGYQMLAEYLPEAKYLTSPRADPAGGWRLLGARLARRAAFSRWYLGGSASLEMQAWRAMRHGFSGIVHSMWADHDLGFLDLLRGGNPLVGSFHNCSDTFVDTIRFPRRLRNFDAIILMSETQVPFFREHGVAPERIHVVPHGVDTDYFRPGVPVAFTVLSAGGYRRNFPLLREVCRRLPGVWFEIIAPKAFRPLFEDAPNARFRSGVDDAEFLQAYQSCSCLLQTTENATANNVVLEAMACGQPVIAERSGGIPEYVDARCSILTGRGDAEGLARAISDVKESPARHAELAAGARARALELDWKNIAAQMRAIYGTL